MIEKNKTKTFIPLDHNNGNTCYNFYQYQNVIRIIPFYMGVKKEKYPQKN